MIVNIKINGLQIGLLFLSILCFGGNVFSESITLKSGKVIEGKIIEDTEKYIKLDYMGVALTYWKDDIERIEKPSETAPLGETSAQKQPEEEVVKIKIKNKVVPSKEEIQEFINKLDLIGSSMTTIMATALEEIGKIKETNLNNQHRTIWQKAVADMNDKIAEIKALKAPDDCKDLQKFAVVNGNTKVKRFLDGVANLSTMDELVKFRNDYSQELAQTEQEYNKERQKILDKINVIPE